MNIKHLFIIIVSAGQLACGSLLRHDNSGYYDGLEVDNVDSESFYQAKVEKEIDDARNELNYSENRSLNENETYALKRRLSLRRLESGIENKNSKLQYYGLKPYFKNDNERIQYLRIPSSVGRKRWAGVRNINARKKAYSTSILKAIEKNDIVEDMTKDAVVESWGQPDAKEISGNEVYGNERWKYNQYKSTSEGYKMVSKVIYFEAGRVRGWERNE